MRRLLLSVTLWASLFIPFTRPDGSFAYVNPEWVQDIAPATDAAACAKGARSVLHMSGQVLCIVEDQFTAWNRLMEDKRASDKERVKP